MLGQKNPKTVLPHEWVVYHGGDSHGRKYKLTRSQIQGDGVWVDGMAILLDA